MKTNVKMWSASLAGALVSFFAFEVGIFAILSAKCEDLNLADPVFAQHYADVVAAEQEGSEIEDDPY